MDDKGARNSFTLDQALKNEIGDRTNIYLTEINSTAPKKDVPFQKGNFDPTIKSFD